MVVIIIMPFFHVGDCDFKNQVHFLPETFGHLRDVLSLYGRSYLIAETLLFERSVTVR